MYQSSAHLADRGSDIASAAAKSAPPVAVIGAGAAGMSLEEWVWAATLLYLILQSVYLIYKFARDLRRDRRQAVENSDV